MNLVLFIENRFQETRLYLSELEQKEQYSNWRDAEIKSLHNILSFYRGVLRWLQVPLIVLRFIAVNLGLQRKPEPVLMRMIKAQKEAEAEQKLKNEEEAQRKSVGMNQKKKPTKPHDH